MYKPLTFAPKSREGLTAEQLAGLARDLCEYYRPRFPKEIMDRLTDEILLDRYFWIKQLGERRAQGRVTAPIIPWDEQQRVKALVERVASETPRYALTFSVCDSKPLKLRRVASSLP